MNKTISHLHKNKVGYTQLNIMDLLLFNELNKDKCYMQADLKSCPNLGLRKIEHKSNNIFIFSTAHLKIISNTQIQLIYNSLKKREDYPKVFLTFVG